MPHGVDLARDVMKTTSVKEIFRAGFNGTALQSNRWDSSTGVAGSQTVTGGFLTMSLNTTANDVNSITSKETFRIPCRLQVSLSLSQRIANQDIHLELVSVNPQTEVPDGLNVASFVFNGTTATLAVCRCQNEGGSNLDSSAQTVISTAGQSQFEIQANLSALRFINTPIDSVGTATLTFVRTQSLPDPNAVYKIRIRGVNGATPPASNTNIVVNYVAASAFENVNVEITDARGPLGLTGNSGLLNININNNGTSSVNTQGAAAHDAVVVGNPVYIGGIARTVNGAAVASGDAAGALMNLVGAQVVLPYAIPESSWQYGSSTAVTNTTDVAVKAAAAAGIRNYVTSLQYCNTAATASIIVVKDGSTVIWAGQAPASMTVPQTINFPVPLRGTAATAINVAMLTTGTNTLVAAQGFIAP